MENIRAVPLRVHEKATLSFGDFEDRIELRLVNKETGQISERIYYKLPDKVIDMNEYIKIDTIIYHMHNEIKLNLWDSKRHKRSVF